MNFLLWVFDINLCHFDNFSFLVVNNVPIIHKCKVHYELHLMFMVINIFLAAQSFTDEVDQVYVVDNSELNVNFVYKNLQAYIFHILQHFATKLCNFTNFRTLFNAVIMNFTISIFFKILSKRQSVHSHSMAHYFPAN